MKRKCILVGANIDNEVDISNLSLEDTFVVAVDGGYNFTKALGVVPELYVGDMDSLKGYVEEDIEKIIFEKNKDFSDMQGAAAEVLKRGYKDIVIIGGLGGRLDHTYSNYCVLDYLRKSGLSATLKSSKEIVKILDCNEKFILKNSVGKTLSILPFGCEKTVISCKGFKYCAKNLPLYIYKTVGLSNIVLEKEAIIEIHEGVALVVVNLR